MSHILFTVDGKTLLKTVYFIVGDPIGEILRPIEIVC